MAYEIAIKSPLESGAVTRPLVTSYDSGYEHSLEHWAKVRRLVEDADQEPVSTALSLMAKAS